MKKLFLLSLTGFFVFFLLIGVLFTGIAGGGESGAAGAAAPVQAFATESEAYAYQYVGTELGVPWDIVLLADAIHAQANGESGMENYNPLYTSLEFCILVEEQKIAEKVEVAHEETEDTETGEESESGTDSTEESAGEPEESEAEDGAGEETQEVEKEKEPEYILNWLEGETTTYSGREEILKYLEMNRQDLTYQDATGIIVKMQEKAEEMSVEEEELYTLTLISNPDYEEVLRSRISLNEQDIANVMELYDAGYMAAMYGYSYDYSNIVLPELVVGDVTRFELAQVSVSLLGHPYLMGGKSSEAGAPKGPLDCSGFVDWVYVQCFGRTVSTGTIPEGIAISGTAQQWFASEAVKESELKIGDLGFMKDPGTMKAGQVNHVGIYLGESNGAKLWIHCGGRYFGTADTPKGRVGISKTTGANNYNPVDGTTFSPSMPGCKFKYFRRPRFAFSGEE